MILFQIYGIYVLATQSHIGVFLNKLNGHSKSTYKKVALEIIHEHFKNLKMQTMSRMVIMVHLNVDSGHSYNKELNQKFSEVEILKAIKSLKNNKSCENDLILNEHLKCAKKTMLKCFCSIFNIVLDTEINPDSWSEGIICTIYKNKGDPGNPDNYRV